VSYRVIKIERENKNLPQMSRYTVENDNGEIIYNFPGYLLNKPDEAKAEDEL
jgi:hypothetical protein